jgi:DNA-binding NarL/FixJ family response regulator
MFSWTNASRDRTKSLLTDGVPIKVLVAEGHKGIRESLRVSLASHGVDVVGVAADGLEAVEKVRSLAPDVVLLDVHIPLCETPLNGGSATARLISAAKPDARIILLATWDDEIYARAADAWGAITCLPKTVQTRRLLSAMGARHR